MLYRREREREHESMHACWVLSDQPVLAIMKWKLCCVVMGGLGILFLPRYVAMNLQCLRNGHMFKAVGQFVEYVQACRVTAPSCP